MAYNNNETYDGTTGGLGSNTTGTNPYGSSNTASGLDSGLRREDNYGSDNYGSTGRDNTSTSGPHNSDMLNKLDPRVDSDNSKAYNNNSSRNTADEFGNTSSGYGSSSTSGPHSSDLSNRADPRIDSDNSRFGSNTTSGLGSNTDAYDSTTSGLGSSGHNTYAGQVLDPNVSDRTGGSTTSDLGSSGTTTGAYGSDNYNSDNRGPHSSNLGNKADPRVDSDFDRTRGPDSHKTTGTGLGSDNYGSSGLGSNTTGSGIGGSDTYGSGKTAGSGIGGSDTYGSGTTSGPGYGNKSSDYDSSSKDGKNDSTMGKLMEKAGSMMKNENMVEKGRTKREEAARPDGSY